jgi:hypothetical protein
LNGDTGYPHLISEVVDIVSNVRDANRSDLLAAVCSNVIRLTERDDHLTHLLTQLDAQPAIRSPSLRPHRCHREQISRSTLGLGLCEALEVGAWL